MCRIIIEVLRGRFSSYVGWHQRSHDKSKVLRGNSWLRFASFQARENHGNSNDYWLVVSTNPSEKWWSSSVGMMTFPIYGKTCSKPPTSYYWSYNPIMIFLPHHEIPSSTHLAQLLLHIGNLTTEERIAPGHCLRRRRGKWGVWIGLRSRNWWNGFNNP